MKIVRVVFLNEGTRFALSASSHSGHASKAGNLSTRLGQSSGLFKHLFHPLVVLGRALLVLDHPAFGHLLDQSVVTWHLALIVLGADQQDGVQGPGLRDLGQPLLGRLHHLLMVVDGEAEKEHLGVVISEPFVIL